MCCVVPATDTTCQTASLAFLHADLPDRWEVCATGRMRPSIKGANGTNQRNGVMFKIIGAAVVYGFALFGLAKYLEAKSDE